MLEYLVSWNDSCSSLKWLCLRIRNAEVFANEIRNNKMSFTIVSITSVINRRKIRHLWMRWGTDEEFLTNHHYINNFIFQNIYNFYNWVHYYYSCRNSVRSQKIERRLKSTFTQKERVKTGHTKKPSCVYIYNIAKQTLIIIYFNEQKNRQADVQTHLHYVRRLCKFR